MSDENDETALEQIIAHEVPKTPEEIRAALGVIERLRDRHRQAFRALSELEGSLIMSVGRPTTIPYLRHRAQRCALCSAPITGGQGIQFEDTVIHPYNCLAAPQ